MSKDRPANERTKRDYLIYHRDSQGRSEQTIDQIASALAQF